VVGKPGLEGQGIDAEWQASDQRRYYVPCPHCGEYHARTFNRVRWWGEQSDGTTGPDSRDLETDQFHAARTAVFKCPNRECLALIGPEYNRWQLSLGVWACGTQGVEPLREGGHFDPEVNDPRDRWIEIPGALIGDAPQHDHAGFHVSGLITGLRPNPYSEAAGEFIRRKGRIDQEFVTDQLGEAWKPVSEKVDDAGLAKHAVAKAQGGYRMGELPDGVRLLIASVDVQVKGAYIEVRGYGDYGRDRWLIWRDFVGAPEKLGLDPLDALLYRMNFGRLKIACRFIDSGDRTDEVYRYCATRPRAFAVKGYAAGRGSGKMQTPYEARQKDKGADGRPLASRIWLLTVNTPYYKSEVARRLRALTEQTEAPGDIDPQQLIEHETGRGGLGRWYFPEDAGDDYFRQLTGEECRTRVINGRTEYEWVKRPGRENHYLDCAVYNEAGFAWVRGAERLQPESTTAQGPVAATRQEPATRSLSRSPLLERARSMKRR
jgi:phage terminase large subunit GpA-like protein